MQKWEYKRIGVSGDGIKKPATVIIVNGKNVAFKNRPLLDDYLQKLGAQGWEMVNFLGDEYSIRFAIFKRPIEG